MGRASRTFWNPLNGVWRLARRWQRTAAAGQRVRGDLGRQWQSGKGPHGGFVSWWPVLRAGYVFAVTWEGSGKAVKAHRGVLCPDGPCFAQVLSPSNSLNGVLRLARRWQRAAAAGQRVRGDLGRQRQSGKGPQTGFVSWWAVLRTRFETL